jgi:hypothetical protein
VNEVARIAYLPTTVARYRVHATNSMHNTWRLVENLGIYLRKTWDRYGHNPEIATFLYAQQFERYAFLGRLQVGAGRITEGKVALGEASQALRIVNERLKQDVHDAALTRYLYHAVVGHYSNLSRIQFKAGCEAEARVSLWEAIRLSLRQRTNAKMLFRSLRRLVRSYLPSG